MRNIKSNITKAESIPSKSKRGRINFEDDIVYVYKGKQEIYKGIEDYEPMKDENWKWNEKDKCYTLGEYTKYYLSESKQIGEGIDNFTISKKTLNNIGNTIYNQKYGKGIITDRLYDGTWEVDFGNNGIQILHSWDISEDCEEATELLEKYNMRKEGLAEAEEFCTENLAFKKLRNEGCMDKLRQIKKEQINKQPSLESYNSVNETLSSRQKELKKVFDKLLKEIHDFGGGEILDIEYEDGEKPYYSVDIKNCGDWYKEDEDNECSWDLKWSSYDKFRDIVEKYDRRYKKDKIECNWGKSIWSYQDKKIHIVVRDDSKPHKSLFEGAEKEYSIKNESIKEEVLPHNINKVNQLIDRINKIGYFKIDGEDISVNKGFGTVGELIDLEALAEQFEELGFKVRTTHFYITVYGLKDFMEKQDNKNKSIKEATEGKNYEDGLWEEVESPYFNYDGYIVISSSPVQDFKSGQFMNIRQYEYEEHYLADEDFINRIKKYPNENHYVIQCTENGTHYGYIVKRYLTVNKNESIKESENIIAKINKLIDNVNKTILDTIKNKKEAKLYTLKQNKNKDGQTVLKLYRSDREFMTSKLAGDTLLGDDIIGHLNSIKSRKYESIKEGFNKGDKVQLRRKNNKIGIVKSIFNGDKDKNDKDIKYLDVEFEDGTKEGRPALDFRKVNEFMNEDYEDDENVSEEMHKERFVAYFETPEGGQKYKIYHVYTDSTDNSYNELCDKKDNQLGMYNSYKELQDALKEKAEKIAAKQGWTVKSIENLGEDEDYYRERNKWESCNEKVEETKNYKRTRLEEPNTCKEGSFRTKQVNDKGDKIVFCKDKETNKMKAQSKLIKKNEALGLPFNDLDESINNKYLEQEYEKLNKILDEANMTEWRNSGKGILHLRTQEAANLFEHEIKGQLSDGAWENSKPDDHWVFWSHTEPVVDGSIGLEVLEGWPVKRGYNLNQLMEYVSDRMICYVIAAKINKDPELTEYLLTFSNNIKNPNNDYWMKKSEMVKKEFGDDLDSVISNIKNLADETDVRRALAEIHKAMTTDYGKKFTPDKKDIEKIKGYYDKGSNPIRLINDISKNVDKLENRYRAAKDIGWTEFTNEVEKRAKAGTIPVTLDRLAAISEKLINEELEEPIKINSKVKDKTGRTGRVIGVNVKDKTVDVELDNVITYDNEDLELFEFFRNLKIQRSKNYLSEDLELSTKVRNAILRKDPNGEYEFKLKNININGNKKGCSGFVRKGDKVVYLTTESTDTGLGYMYREAKDFNDFTGGRNRWAKTFDALVTSVVDLLR